MEKNRTDQHKEIGCKICKKKSKSYRKLNICASCYSSINDSFKSIQDSCYLCDSKIIEIHHIHPVSKGGVHSHGNLVALCPTHHILSEINKWDMDDLEMVKGLFVGHREDNQVLNNETYNIKYKR
jgi:5-methylcytosine-specific restriction endonuclease McrA